MLKTYTVILGDVGLPSFQCKVLASDDDEAVREFANRMRAKPAFYGQVSRIDLYRDGKGKNEFTHVAVLRLDAVTDVQRVKA